MTKDFEALKRRVVAAGGEMCQIDGIYTSKAWTVKIGGSCYRFDNTANHVKILTGYLDGLDADARARRCVEHFDKESNIKCFMVEDSTAADLLHCTDVNSKADAYRDAAKFIRREFGIEEAK